MCIRDRLLPTTTYYYYYCYYHYYYYYYYYYPCVLTMSPYIFGFISTRFFLRPTGAMSSITANDSRGPTLVTERKKPGADGSVVFEKPVIKNRQQRSGDRANGRELMYFLFREGPLLLHTRCNFFQTIISNKFECTFSIFTICTFFKTWVRYFPSIKYKNNYKISKRKKLLGLCF